MGIYQMFICEYGTTPLTDKLINTYQRAQCVTHVIYQILLEQTDHNGIYSYCYRARDITKVVYQIFIIVYYVTYRSLLQVH